MLVGQSVQLEAPEMLAYFPESHAVQLEELESAKLPAKQLEQVVEVVAPVTEEYMPAEQLTHDDEPWLTE